MAAIAPTSFTEGPEMPDGLLSNCFKGIDMSDEKLADSFHPNAIKFLRKHTLGLTQKEAGKLLGGGPRAFTKYESGRTKPSGSMLRLMAVLRYNPQMIKTLEAWIND